MVYLIVLLGGIVLYLWWIIIVYWGLLLASCCCVLVQSIGFYLIEFIAVYYCILYVIAPVLLVFIYGYCVQFIAIIWTNILWFMGICLLGSIGATFFRFV